MAGYNKLDKFKIVEMKDGCVFKTEKVGSEWFLITEQPTTDIPDENGYLWAATNECYFGPTKPTN